MSRQDVVIFNRKAWDRQVEKKNQWTLPVSSEQVANAKNNIIEIYLTPWKRVPADWLGNVNGKNILCLASGGGQQGPLLAAAGANVTVLDISANQLLQDRKVAEFENLQLHTVLADMSDLSMFEDATFDLIIHPVSNCFIPDIEPVWRECRRLLKPGGVLLCGFANPLIYAYDEPDDYKTDQLILKNKIPYSDADSLAPEIKIQYASEGTAMEFGHTLEAQIGGQIAAGFNICGFYEDRHHRTEHPIYALCETFIATRAVKI